jgi:hypothetical protein
LVEELMATKAWERQFIESLERGIVQSIERGRQKERRVQLRRLLEQRFGPIPMPLEVRIIISDTETLATLFDRALAAPTLADL